MAGQGNKPSRKEHESLGCNVNNALINFVEGNTAQEIARLKALCENNKRSNDSAPKEYDILDENNKRVLKIEHSTKNVDGTLYGSYVLYKYNPQKQKGVNIGELEYVIENNGNPHEIMLVHTRMRGNLKHLMNAYLKQYAFNTTILDNCATVNNIPASGVYNKYGFQKAPEKDQGEACHNNTYIRYPNKYSPK